jgi:hypothetical protein
MYTYFITLFFDISFEEKGEKIDRLFSEVFSREIVTSLKMASFLSSHTPQVITKGSNLYVL